MQRIITIANRLPVTVAKTIKKSSGGLVSALEGVRGQADLYWMGWPGTHVSDKAAVKKLSHKLRKDFHCHPVFLSPSEIKKYYQGFSNACLWPALHYFMQYMHHDESWWEAYVEINQRFAKEAASVAKNDDIIWVHDYHLFLVPSMIRKINPKLRIGFFLHTPFPSYEIFRCVPHREEILQGLLGADLIGFHTYGYLRHFRSSVMRLLKINPDMDRLHIDQRVCQLGVFPIGINADAFVHELQTQKFEKRRKYFQSIYRDHQVILSIERLDYTKGILRRLEAIEKFLSIKSAKDKPHFVFVSVPSRGEVKEYRELRESIEQEVGRINGKYGQVDYTPIQFIHGSVNFTDLCAMYSLADVAMVTPLIDGMNLVAKEYLACQYKDPGVLMLSEFAGAAVELFSALKVNPYDIDDIVKSLKQALRMPSDEKTRRTKAMRKHILTYDAKYWAKTFIEELKGLDLAAVPESNSKIIEQKPDEIIRKVQKAKKAAVFLDYDGTLREFEARGNQALPTQEILRILKGLSEQKNMDVFVVSGRKSDDLQKWLGKLPITLIAEHGLKYLTPESKEWHLMHENCDFSWKERVQDVLAQYTQTTPGSYIEEKVSSVVWHYRQSDPEFGSWKAQNLISFLCELFVNYPVKIEQGHCIVEISSSECNKGVALRHFVEQGNYQVVFCAGDDRTDEAMFAVHDKRLISLKIGEGDTAATYRLASPVKFRTFLKKLYRKPSKSKKG